MDDCSDRILTCKLAGLSCSQTVMKLVGLEPRGEKGEALIAAMGGLSYGMLCQHTCGCLTGAACALALYAPSKETLAGWCRELDEWFTGRFGAASCRELVGEGAKNPALCLEFIRETVVYCLELRDDADLL